MKLVSWRNGAILTLLLITTAALAQRGRRPASGDDDFDFPEQSEFHFLRVEYTDLPGARRGFGFVSRNGRGNGWWMQDWPDADNHFSFGIQRLTRINIGVPEHVGLDDD